MDDMISRQAAVDGVKTLHEVAWKNWHDPTLSANVVIDMIKDLPSAQSERKPGKWEYIGDNMVKCTSCGVVYTTRQLNALRTYTTDPYFPKFCPNCGTMVG